MYSDPDFFEENLFHLDNNVPPEFPEFLVSHGEKRVTKSLQDNSPAAKELNRILKKTYSLIDSAEKPLRFLYFSSA
jgi:hypothetical protein